MIARGTSRGTTRRTPGGTSRRTRILRKPDGLRESFGEMVKCFLPFDIYSYLLH